MARQAEVQTTTADGSKPEATPIDIQSVDVDSLELTRPRSVAVEQVGLWVMQQLGFIALLSHLGNRQQITHPPCWLFCPCSNHLNRYIAGYAPLEID